jgi:hypothetical protein
VRLKRERDSSSRFAPTRAEIAYNPNHKPEVKLIGEGFGFFLLLGKIC